MRGIFYGTVGNPRRGFLGEKGTALFVKDGLDRHGGAAQTALYLWQEESESCEKQSHISAKSNNASSIRA